MRINLITLFILAFFTASISSCVNTKKLAQHNREGLITCHSVDYFTDKSSNVEDYKFNVWYKDSSIIIEYVYVLFDFLPDSNSKPPSLKTLKYVYVNLQNFSCQDYKNLDADEYPLTNYKLKKGQFIQWNFFWENEFVDNTFKTYMELSDTTIENINYKRILFKGEEVEPFWQRILYLTDKSSQNNIHLDRELDKKYYPFKLIRVDQYTKGRINSSNYFDEIKTNLSDNEKAVFKKWSLNADTTTLPVLTLEEVREVDIKERSRRTNENH